MFPHESSRTVKYFLGLEDARSPAGIYLGQRKYATDTVEETCLLGCKPAGSPIDQNHKLSLADGPLLPDPEQYIRLIGRCGNRNSHCRFPFKLGK